MSESPLSGVLVRLPVPCKDALRQLARENQRSMGAQAGYLLRELLAPKTSNESPRP
jgi:hypothetical protein